MDPSAADGEGPDRMEATAGGVESELRGGEDGASQAVRAGRTRGHPAQPRCNGEAHEELSATTQWTDCLQEVRAGRTLR